MVHGAPDNFEVQQKATIFRLDDMAELAARLHSPNTFHRLGEVVLLDSFENGIDTWESEDIGATSDFSISSSKYKTGGFSAKLAAGNLADDYMNIGRNIQILNECKIGFEFSFAFSTVHAIIDFKLGYHNGTDIYNANAIFNTTNNTLSIQKSDGLFKTISSSIKLYKGLSIFHTTKLIIDIKNKKYDKIIINNNIFNLEDYGLYDSGDSIWEYLYFTIKLQTTGAGTTYTWLDDIIITQNEP